MHSIMVTILRRLRPPFPQRGIGAFPVPENPPFLWEILLFLEDLLYESTLFLHQEIGGKR